MVEFWRDGRRVEKRGEPRKRRNGDVHVAAEGKAFMAANLIRIDAAEKQPIETRALVGWAIRPS